MKGSEKKSGIRRFFSKLVKKKDKQKRSDQNGQSSSDVSMLTSQPSTSSLQLEKHKKGGGDTGSQDIKRAMEAMDATRKSARIPVGTVKTTVNRINSRDMAQDKAVKDKTRTTGRAVNIGETPDEVWVPRQQTNFSQLPRQPRPFLLDTNISRNIGNNPRGPVVQRSGPASDCNTKTVLPVIYPRSIPLNPGLLRRDVGQDSQMDTDSLDAVIPAPATDTPPTSTSVSHENSPIATVRVVNVPERPSRQNYTKQPSASGSSVAQASSTNPQDTVIHYHVTLQNCDGIKIKVGDGEKGGLSPRGLHFDDRGALARLSWMEGGPQPALPAPREPISVDYSSSLDSRSRIEPCMESPRSGSNSSRNLKVGSVVKVPLPTTRVPEQRNTESPPHKTAKLEKRKHGKKDKRGSLERTTSKSTPELRTPDVSTVPKTANSALIKGKGKSKRRRRRPKSQNIEAEMSVLETGDVCDPPVSQMDCSSEPASHIDDSSTDPPITEQSDTFVSSVLSQKSSSNIVLGSSSSQRSANVSSSGSDGSGRAFPWHSNRENIPPPSAGSHRRLVRPTPTYPTHSVQPSIMQSSPSSSSTDQAGPQKRELASCRPNTFNTSAQMEPRSSVSAISQQSTSIVVPSLPISASSDNPDSVTNGSIIAVSDEDSSGSGSSRPVAKVTPVRRPPNLTDSSDQDSPRLESPRTQDELQILQLENQRTTLILQLQQEQERAALLDNLQRQQEEFEEEIAHREAEFIREEAERRSRRILQEPSFLSSRNRSISPSRPRRGILTNRSSSRSIERSSNRSLGDTSASRALASTFLERPIRRVDRSASRSIERGTSSRSYSTSPVDRGRERHSRSRERRARVEISVEERTLPPEVEAEVSAMEAAFRREVAERRSRRYRRHIPDTAAEEETGRSTERLSRREQTAVAAGERESNEGRARSGQRRARFDDENLTQIMGEPRRRPRSLSANRSHISSRNRLNRSNSVSVPESDDDPLPRRLIAVKNQLVSVPGVLIVGSKRGKLVAYLSRDRPNIDGVVRFMIDHNIQRAEYECEIVPYRYRTRLRGTAAGTSVLVA